ncbi:hypothetical protein ANCCAN_25656 [Ancylostoma caninum]|uniref:Uncharacterized protein n=1 Tax=Ancylostoma caninum TaxID=29170 RepID=A0A368FAF8_ANCCA|nr:hypothetical protein ANCCAN_25656 [Ancylostoma caninum]
MHALLQKGNFGFDSPFCFKGVGFSGVDISLFSGEQELIPVDGPRTVCCDLLCRCPKRCPFDEKWDEALNGDLETVKARFRDDPSRKNSPPPKNDSSSSAKTFSGLKSGFLNKKRQTPAEQKRSTKPHTAPASSEGISRSELSGIRKGFLLRGRSKEPPNADVISLDSTKPSAQPISTTVDVRPNITKSSVSQSEIPEEPRKFRKLRSRVKPPISLVAEPALEVERPPIQLPEPEVIAPIKCSCCQSNIKPKEEVYYEVECVEDCKLFIHKHCLHNGMTSQNIKKKKELKDARCFTDGCSALLHTIHEWNMDNSRELYIKCCDKHQPKGDAVSKKHKHKDKRCKGTEKTREKGDFETLLNSKRGSNMSLNLQVSS